MGASVQCCAVGPCTVGSCRKSADLSIPRCFHLKKCLPLRGAPDQTSLCNSCLGGMDLPRSTTVYRNRQWPASLRVVPAHNSARDENNRWYGAPAWSPVWRWCRYISCTSKLPVVESVPRCLLHAFEWVATSYDQTSDVTNRWPLVRRSKPWFPQSHWPLKLRIWPRCWDAPHDEHVPATNRTMKSFVWKRNLRHHYNI